MAQLGARFNGIEEVEGSNPSGSTTIKNPGLSTGVCNINTGVVGYLPASRGHRVQATAKVFAEHSLSRAILGGDQNQTRLLHASCRIHW